MAGGLSWSARDYAGADDLDGAWFVVVGSGDAHVDDAVRRDALAARVWCLDAALPDAGTAGLPPTARVATPDGTVTVATHSPGDAALAVDVTRAVDGLLAGGALDLRRHRARRGAGWVALVGGGPGADGLLTTRARELLAAADVVVLDRLAPRGVVERLPPSVRVVDVGKAPGRHALSQDRINDLLVEEALAGRAVVRLKGGDPYVLGRGGEERLACEAHGIRVEVVPGVSSAVAVPAAAGIPVTHRGVARGFTVVTGHDELPEVPPGTDHTVVLLMGVGRLARSARSLLAAGRPASARWRSSSAASRPTSGSPSARSLTSPPGRMSWGSRTPPSSSSATSCGSAPTTRAERPAWSARVARPHYSHGHDRIPARLRRARR